MVWHLISWKVWWPREGGHCQMINRIIRNCNAAWKTNVAPVESIRYSDEIDTDEELGPLPCTEDNAGARSDYSHQWNNVCWGGTLSADQTGGQGGNSTKERKRTRCTHTNSSQGTPRFTSEGEGDGERVEEEGAQQEFFIMSRKGNIGTDQVPLLSVRSDITRKRLTCLSREHHLPDWRER